jgi:hypothetical protein
MAKLSKHERERVEVAVNTISKAQHWARGFSAANPNSLLNPSPMELGVVKAMLHDLLKD